MPTPLRAIFGLRGAYKYRQLGCVLQTFYQFFITFK